MIKKFGTYNESVRDKMTPKSKEDLRKYIDTLVPGEKLKKGIEFGVLTKQEARDMIDRLDPEFRLSYGLQYSLLSPREIHEIFITLPLFKKMRLMSLTNYRYSSEKLMDEFKTLSASEQESILNSGIINSFTTNTDYRGTYIEKFERLLKRLRKISAKKIAKSKRWGRKEYFINEGIRDKMTPKPKVEIEEGINRLDVDFVPFKDIIKACSGVYDSESIRRINDHSFRYTFRASGLVYTVSCFRLDTYEKGYYKMKLAVTEGRHRPSRVVDIHGVEDVLRIVDRGKEFMRGLNESVRDRMTGKSEEDIMKSIEKHLNRFSKLGTFDYRKYGLAFTDGDLNTNTYKMVDREGNEWFMRLEHYSGDKGRITIYAPPNKLLRVHANERFYSYSELEDYLDKIYGLNESVRDKMTPTSVGDIISRISGMKSGELYKLVWRTALYEDWDTMKVLLDNNVDINMKNNNSETLLTDFVRTNDYTIVKVLLDLGADPNIGNDNGYTPLMIATFNDTTPIVELLLSSDKLNPMKHDQLNAALRIARDKFPYVEKILVNHKNGLVSEGVRDKMTPKSEDDINRSIIQTMNDYDNSGTIYPESSDYNDFQHIADLFDESVDNLFVITELDDKWEVINGYLSKLVREDDNYILFDELDGKSIGGEWFCYPERKIAFFKNRPGQHTLHLWAYCKPFDQTLNEGIRDKMTPISQDDMLKKLCDLKDYRLVDFIKGAIDKRDGFLIDKIFGCVKLDELKKDDIISIIESGMVYEEYRFLLYYLDMGLSKDVLDEILKSAYRLASYKSASLIRKYIKKESISESVKDKMTPKSKEDINRLQMKKIHARHFVFNYFNDRYDIDRGVKDVYMDEITRVADLYDLPEDEVLKVVRTFDNIKVNESIRDKMTPKSEEDIRGIIKNLSQDKLFNAFGNAVCRNDKLDMWFEMGVDINITDNNGNTVLHELCWMDGVDHLVKKVLDLGADPNMVNKDGDTPLTISVIATTIPNTRVILNSDKLEPYKHNQLQKAIDLTRKDEDIRKILIDYDLKQPLTESVRDKMTPKSEEDIKRDLDKLPPDKKLNKGIKAELPWLVEDALKSGANPNMTYPGSSYPKGFTCLMKVVLNSCNLDIIKLLVKYGADVNAKTKNGWSLLSILEAHMKGRLDSHHYQTAYDFLKSKVNRVDESIRDKMTPKSDEELRKGFDHISPMSVLNYGNSELIPWVIDYALERGANPELRFRINNMEMTPLEHAALKGNMEVVKVLLKHNVRITKDALGNALYNKHRDIYDTLENFRESRGY